MTTTLQGPGPTEDHVWQMHRFLTARGWKVQDYGSPATAWPANGDSIPDPETGWVYPAAYHGETINHIDDVSPTRPAVWFNLEGALVIVTAGNYAGCPEHRQEEHRYQLDTARERVSLDDVAARLDTAEAAARELDPRALIECRFFGACGQDR